LKVSLFFARQSVRSLRCQLRSLTVVAQRVARDIVERAVFRNLLRYLPITATSSPSYSTGPGRPPE
jgi:hypothetical protein